MLRVGQRKAVKSIALHEVLVTFQADLSSLQCGHIAVIKNYKLMVAGIKIQPIGSLAWYRKSKSQ